MTSDFQAGFAQVDITPPTECSLIGYTQRVELHGEGNDGVLDPLEARIFVFEQESLRAVLVSLDICILENPAAEALRARVAEAVGTTSSQVMVAATHTHSGPYPWQPHWSAGAREFVPDAVRATPSQHYWSAFVDRITAAAKNAALDLRPARLHHREARLGFAYNRRVSTPEGIRMCWNPKTFEGPPPLPATDDLLSIVDIQREHDRMVLFNLAGHPVVLGKESNRVSADWPGVARRLIEEALPGSHPAFLHGAGADAHPWLATDHHPEDLETVAAPVAAMINLHLRSGGEDSADDRLSILERSVALSTRSITLTAWRLGPVRILGVPGELFGQSGRQLREACSGPLLIATTTNGWTGYLPPESVFDQGGYELEAVQPFGIQRGDTERLLAGAKSMLEEI